MADDGVRGVDQLGVLSRQLKALGRNDLRKELHKGIGHAVKGLRRAAKDGAAEGLPQRGGLAAKVSGKLRVVVSNVAGGKNPGVRLKGRLGNYGLSEMDDGLIYSKKQGINPGWWTDSLTEAGGPAVREEIERVIDNVSKKLAGG